MTPASPISPNRSNYIQFFSCGDVVANWTFEHGYGAGSTAPEGAITIPPNFLTASGHQISGDLGLTFQTVPGKTYVVEIQVSAHRATTTWHVSNYTDGTMTTYSANNSPIFHAFKSKVSETTLWLSHVPGGVDETNAGPAYFYGCKLMLVE